MKHAQKEYIVCVYTQHSAYPIKCIILQGVITSQE